MHRTAGIICLRRCNADSQSSPYAGRCFVVRSCAERFDPDRFGDLMSMVTNLQAGATLTLQLLAVAPPSLDPSSWTNIEASGYRPSTLSLPPSEDLPAGVGGELTFVFDEFDAAAGVVVAAWGLTTGGAPLQTGPYPSAGLPPTVFIGMQNLSVDVNFFLCSQLPG